MIYIAIMSGAAAAIHFSMMLISLAFARAPGWQSYRVFALIAFLLGLYATNNALVLQGAEVSSLTNLSGRMNVSIGVMVPALWLVFSRVRNDELFTHIDKALLAILVPLAILTHVPGVVVTGTHLTDIESLGLSYRTPDVSAIGQLLYGVSLVTMIVITNRYIQKARGGTTGAKVSALGMVVFVLLACEEVLVALEFVNLPYLADLGFAGVTLSFAAELSSRVSDESIALKALNRDLEELVDARSSDLAETREALLVAERHAAIGQLASGVGHEINNPLAYVSGNLTFLRDYEGIHTWTTDELEAIDEALDGVERISRIVRDLTVFSGNSENSEEVADVQRAIRSAIRIAGSQHKLDTMVRTNVASIGNVKMDESKLTQVLVNLLVNAAQASVGQGPHKITVECVVVEGKQVIEVSDTGTGIDAASLERIFDPLYTTKEVGQGTGLGLYVCRGIVQEAGGSISVKSVQGVGTTFSLELPATTRKSTTITTIPPKTSAESAVLDDDISIYIIDDEAHVTRALQRMLKGSDVVLENDGLAALRHLEANANYDVVICDLMMPNFTGMELFEALDKANSTLRSHFLFITGGAVTSAAEEFLERNDIKYLLKPIMPNALTTAINDIVRAHEPT
tara:strand:+ start:34223 stop:36106 length:1884 start_codon:yes stop_codon:yes gene_type:complete